MPMVAAPSGALPPSRAVALLALACVAAVGPFWAPGTSLLLGDLVGYFPSLFGSLPAAWDPMVQGGTPLLPNPQAGAFYPPAWLLRGDLQAGLPWFLFLHFLLGAVATWAWVRTRFGDGWEALLGGLVFALGGATFSLSLTPDKLPGHALLPAFLLGLHWWLGDDRPRRRQGGLLLSAGAVAGMWCAGSIEAVFMAAMAGPLWAAFLPGAPAAARLSRAAAAVGGLAVGTALASVLLVPFAVLLPETARAGALPLAEAMHRATHPVDWLGWVSPNPFWEGEELRYVLDEAGTARARWLRSLYGGAAAIALWPALSARRTPGTALALAGFGGFALLALGDASPLSALVHAVPGLGSVRYPDKWWLGTLPMQAWLAASALRAVRESPAAAGRAAAAVLLLLVGAGLGAALGGDGGPAQRAAARLIDATPALAVVGAVLLSHARGRTRLAWLIPLVVAGDLIGASLRVVPWADGDAWRAPSAAVSAIRADGTAHGWGLGGPRGPARVWDESLHVMNRLPDASPGEPFRAMQRAVLAPNTATEHGIAYIDGMRALRMRRQGLFTAVLEDLPVEARRRLLRAAGNEYWLVLGVDEARALVAAGLRVVPPAQGVPLDVIVLAEPAPLGRVRRVFGWRSFPDDAAAYRWMQERDEPDVVAVIVGDPGIDTLPASPAAGGLGAVQWRSAGPGRWEAAWDDGGPSLLVVQEVWAPGWEVSIGGGPWAPALRVEHLLVGALVPAGPGSAVLRYRPPGLAAGVGLSLLGLLLLGLGVGRVGRPPDPRPR